MAGGCHSIHVRTFLLVIVSGRRGVVWFAYAMCVLHFLSLGHYGYFTFSLIRSMAGQLAGRKTNARRATVWHAACGGVPSSNNAWSHILYFYSLPIRTRYGPDSTTSTPHLLDSGECLCVLAGHIIDSRTHLRYTRTQIIFMCNKI